MIPASKELDEKIDKTIAKYEKIYVIIEHLGWTFEDAKNAVEEGREIHLNR